jgi:hypothetical protein
MRVYSLDNPKDWTCESCLSSNIVLPEACRKKDMMRSMTLDTSEIFCRAGMGTAGPSSGGQVCSKRQKPVETHKVKFLPHDEAIKLSSAATKRGTPLQTNCRWKPGPSYSLASSQRTLVGSRTTPPKCSTLREKENPSLGPLGLVKPPRHGGVHSMINQQAPRALKKFKGDNSYLLLYIYFLSIQVLNQLLQVLTHMCIYIYIYMILKQVQLWMVPSS